MNILLLASCVEPIIKKNISNQDVYENIKDLNYNLENILKKYPNIFDKFEIVIADCSENFKLEKKDIKCINIKYWSNLNVKILNISFSKKDILRILKKGKGYSEILLIKYSLLKLNLKKDDKIFKLTARYSLLFPRFTLNYYKNLGEQNDIVILISRLFKRTSCHFFIFKYSFFKEYADNLLLKLNDYDGNILEVSLFQLLTIENVDKKIKFKRSKIFSFYKNKLKPGSTLARKNSSNYLYQILRNLAFLI